MNNLQSGDMTNALSIIKDPFDSQYIKSIHIFAGKNLFNDDWHYNANVEFRNGNTEGKQSFEGENLADVIRKVDIFIKELETAKA